MTAGELSDVFERLPRDEEVLIRALDSDEEPMFLLVDRVTTEPEGIIINVGEEIEFEEVEGQT